MRASIVVAALIASAAFQAGTAHAQLPAETTTIFRDDFEGSIFNTGLWTTTGGPPTISSGFAFLAGNKTMRAAYTASGANTNVYLFSGASMEQGAGSGEASIGITIYNSIGTAIGGVTYGNSDLVGGNYFSYGLNGFESLDTAPPASSGTNTFAFITTATTFDLKRNGTTTIASGTWPASIAAYRVSPYASSSSTGSTGVDQVRMWTTAAPSDPAALAVASTGTSNLNFGSLGWTAAVTNTSGMNGVINIDQVNSAPIQSFPATFAIGPRYFNISGMTGLTFDATLTYTFPTSEIAAAGLTPGELRAYKKSGSSPWAEIPHSITTSGANTIVTMTGNTSFSLFAFGGNGPAAAENWSAYE